MLDQLLFGVLPYIALLLFVGGLLLRAFHGHWVYSARGDLQWSTRSTGFFGRQSIGPAALCLHWGIVLLFVAHLIGWIGASFGVSAMVEFFRWVGLFAGVLFVYGVTFALLRRVLNRSLRAMSTVDDYIVLVLLLIIVSLGLYQAAVAQVFGVVHSVAPWLNSVLCLRADVQLIASIPLVNKIHIVAALLLLCYIPFSKLAHLASIPWTFWRRPPIVLRRYWALKK